MKNKKYGLVVFKDTQNIGDDIQSYAAVKYLPKIDYFIERESLNEFVSDNGEVVNTIMNGWYMHDIASMPPSPFINPLFVSVHFTDHLYGECPEYLSGYLLEYLKKYQPFGCRDEVVRKYLTDNDITNYWSGCLTLTIEPFKDVKKEDYICAVDLTDEELAHLRKVTQKEIRILTHTLDDKVNSKLSYEERLDNVCKLLKTYQGASLVVTSRLHSALPSLALKTPVIMICDIENIDKKNRIGVFLDLLNHVTSLEFLEGKVDQDIKNPKSNSDKYLKIKESLEKEVNDFMVNRTVDYVQNKELSNLYKDYFVEQKKYLVSILKEQAKHDIDSVKDYYENLINVYKNEYETQIYELTRQLNRAVLREEVALKEREEAIENYRRKVAILEGTLSGIVNSRGYRLLEKLRKLKGKFIKSR